MTLRGVLCRYVYFLDSNFNCEGFVEDKPLINSIALIFLFPSCCNSKISIGSVEVPTKKLLLSKYFNNQSSIWKVFKENNIYASNFQPKNLINTPLSNFLYEGNSTVPYISQEDLIIALSDSLFLENKFNFIYYPNIDISAHVFGVNSDEWLKEIKIFEELVKKINSIHAIDEPTWTRSNFICGVKSLNVKVKI